ncbi:thiol reductase thioredoxin [Nocardiopsis sp. TSRI0078]|uniref:thioredoxin family protein n=1 Tax=unclassified Nocardiopsis TaxID=2649073 RepID=UPI0009391848|nr:thioredoxin domain-containing protein [Nocardiopsis sp. TSRI0078]OKI14445.1 thiol reductase thioredoxin [Nocardiopsis sp. TSRI0078]
MSPVNMPAEVPAVTDESFEREVIGHDGPVLLYFWAQWCPSCRMAAPVVARIAEERADSLTVRRINADENPLTTRDQQVMSLPTLMLFLGGRPVLTMVGARSRARLLSEADAALAG